MPKVAASIRLANARKRIDDMLVKARARVDKILANRSTSATDAHAIVYTGWWMLRTRNLCGNPRVTMLWGANS